MISLMIIEEGDGAAVKTGDIVDTFYSGKLMNGFEFDHNLDDEDTVFTF